MKPLTPEWVEKAEADLRTALREYRARKAPNHDAVCFLAQQCVEKYLKARLQEASIPFGKTHNLVGLLRQAAPVEPSWSLWEPTIAPLTAFATVFRYPGKSATRDEARDALKVAEKFRQLARQSLGLTDAPKKQRKRTKKAGGKPPRYRR